MLTQARLSISVQNRAWITADIVQISYRGNPDGEINFDVQLSIKNIGNTPAINTETSMAADVGYAVSRDDTISWAGVQRTVQRKDGRVVFPAQSYVRDWVPFLEGGEFERSKIGGITIVGCVTYDTVYDDEIHQSAFAYGVELGTGFIREDGVTMGACTFFVLPGGFTS